MNAFNRVFVTLVALALTGAGVLALLLLAGVVGPGVFGYEGPLFGSAQRVYDVGPEQRALAYGASAGVVIAGLALLIIEIKPRRRSGAFLVSTSELGSMTVEREGLCRMAERVAGTVEGVASARATMEPRDEGVACRCLVSLHSDAPLKDIGAELQSRLREAVEEQVGIHLVAVEVKARITNEPAPERSRVVD